MSARIRSLHWGFAGQTWVLTMVGVVIGIALGEVATAGYGFIAGWFGFIYLIAATLSIAVLLLVPFRSLERTTGWPSLLWFVASGVSAVALTLLYSVLSAAPRSGTPDAVVIGMQFFHSAAFFILSLVVAVLWQLWQKVPGMALHGSRRRT